MVMVVSRWPVSAVAEVLSVSKSPRGCVPSAKQFALQAQNGRKMLFSGALGEFYAEVRAEAPCGASLWLLDAGLVPPPTSRACHRPYISGIPPVVVARGRLRWARINRLSAGFQLFRRNGSQPLYLGALSRQRPLDVWVRHAQGPRQKV